MVPLDKLAQITERFEYLEARLNAGASPSEIAALSREYSELKPVCDQISAYRTALHDLEEAEGWLSDPEMKVLAEEELPRLKARIPEMEQALRVALLPRDAADARPAILEIRPGTGGEEASLFAGDLLRMYQRYAERMGWRFEILEQQLSDLGGIKEVTAHVQGEGVFARLKYESGVHRVQRVPETEAGGRIHTSAATVAVLPEAEEVDIDIPSSDIRIDTMRSSGAGGQHVNTTDSAVRITHIPSGIVVSCQNERSQLQNKATAMGILQAKLLERRRQEEQAKIDALKGDSSGSWGNQMRSYVLHPYQMVKDLRTEEETGNTQAVLDGEIDAFVASGIRWRRQQSAAS